MDDFHIKPDPLPASTIWLRVPGRCLSLIYCTADSGAGPDNRSTFAASSFRQRIDFVHGRRIFFAYFKFRHKLLWLKLMVLMLLGRDFWLAVSSRRVVGILGIRYDKLTHLPLQAHEACVYTIIVAEECRGQRIGLLLLEEATTACQGGGKVVLLEVGEHNNSMIRMLRHTRLYQFCGVSQRELPLQQPKSIL